MHAASDTSSLGTEVYPVPALRIWMPVIFPASTEAILALNPEPPPPEAVMNIFVVQEAVVPPRILTLEMCPLLAPRRPLGSSAPPGYVAPEPDHGSSHSAPLQLPCTDTSAASGEPFKTL